MNYTQTLEFLFQSLPVFETQGATAYKPGLERITAFCRHIGNPQRNFFTIHVAGTNGKGSVAHIIASVLQQAGYRTGLFTSPHLQDFRERIRVDGEMIPKQKVVNFVDKHHDKMVELELSFFEMTAAMAFDYFAQSDVEVAVIETGLGGRLDATNIIVPILSVITNIGLEHTSLLGDTLPKIAAEKAGIIKKSIPVIIGEADARYNGVIEQAAAANKSRVIYAEQEFSCEEHHMKGTGQSFRLHRSRDGRAFDVSLDLQGNYQSRNIVTASAAVDFLHEETPLTISRRAYLEGMRCAAANTALMGRWQTLAESPLTVCDTGHNAHGIAYVADQLKATPHRELYCVIGFVRDKDLAHILPLLPRDAHYIFTQAHSERALPAAEPTADAAPEAAVEAPDAVKAEEQAQAKPEAQVESRPAEDLKPAEDLFAGMDVGASELVQVETTAKAEPSDYVEAQPRGRKPVHQAVEAAEEPLVQIETRSAEAEAPKTEADLLKSPEHMADVAQLITESFEKSDRRPRRSRRSKVKPDETVKTHLKPIAEAVAGIVAEPDPLGKIAVTAKALETKEEEAGKVQVQAEAVELKAEAVEAAAESAVEAAPVVEAAPAVGTEAVVHAPLMGDVAEGLEANLARAGLEQVHTKPELVTFKGYDVVRYSGRPMPVKAEGETEGPLEQVHTRPELCRPVVYEAVRYPGRPYQAPAALNEEPLVQVHTREA